MAAPLGFELRDAPQLQPFLLPNVRPTGRTIGGGAYGTVEELDVDGLLCAGKQLHDVLAEGENHSTPNILRKFVEECSLLSDLRHPCIVQFLGVCFLDVSDLPVLVMEYLPYCLDSLLDPEEGAERVDIPLSTKCTILCDVAQGLVYLHARRPPVIHRDLTAKNVLLTAAMRGKIADLGVARILNLQTGQVAVSMTQTLGTLVYMSPEVHEPNPHSAIDMFSFGHLLLYTIAQIHTCIRPNRPRAVIACTEVQRHSEQMEQLVRQLGGQGHPLVQLVTQCLHNDPRQRPSARQVLSQLEGVRAQIEDPYEGMSKLELIQALRRRERGGGEGALQAQVAQLQEQLRASGVELEASRAETQQVQSRLEQVQGQLQAEVQRYLSRIRHVEAQWRADVRQLQASKAEVQSRLSQAHPPPRSFHWRQGRDLLFGTREACAVVLNGKVYVGGGEADRDEEFIIQVYSPERNGWSQLPECPVKWFAMAVVNQQLVLVGGRSRDGHDQSAVVVWDITSQQWTSPYPNMPTAQESPAAVGYQHFLVVAGAVSGQSFLTTVEILDTSAKQWYTAAPLPVRCVGFTPALVGDTLYLLGGWSGIATAPSKQLFSTSLPALVSHATSTPHAPPPTWEVMETELDLSTAVSLHNSLLAVGGRNDRGRCSSAIHLYNPQTKGWTKVGDVPLELPHCSCAVLPSGELMVLGGSWVAGYGRSSYVYIAQVN